jgi:hypothetical protein
MQRGALWQEMYRGQYFEGGRVLLGAQSAIDIALYDIVGKALNVPVYDLIGGMNRSYVESYLGGGGTGTRLKEAARAAIEAGYRAFRMDSASVGGRGGGGAETDAGPLPGPIYNTHERARQVVKDCKDVREGVGPNGDWLIDLHQRFDLEASMRICKLIEEYEPYLVEDPTRDEQFRDEIPKLRMMTTVPLAAGEEWGQRWDFHKLVENKDSDKLDDLTKKQIDDALVAELTKKGLTVSTGTADVYVGYQASVSTEKQVNTFDSGYAYGPGWGGPWGYGGWGGGMSTSTTQTIYNGTLVVDFYDVTTKKLVWRGAASKTIDVKAKPEKREKNLAKAAQKLFKNYPPVVKEKK